MRKCVLHVLKISSVRPPFFFFILHTQCTKEEPKLLIDVKTIHDFLYHRPTMRKRLVYVLNHRSNLYDVERFAKEENANISVIRGYRRTWYGKRKLQTIRILHPDGEKSEYKLA